jgi:hypothetical protein
MTWLTWRQFRPQAATATAALAAFAVLLAVTGPHLASLYAASGITGCRSGSCGQLAGNFLGQVSGIYPVVYMLGLAGVVLAPAVIGIFWGAPLVAREFETGTFRLAWTQTITRARWLSSKLALPGLAAMAVTEGLSLMCGWWAAPIGQAARLTGGSSFPLGMGPFSLLAFDARGVTPLGYAAFAFTLGVIAGILIRRAVPAMAVTLAVFAAVQVAMPLAIRPHLFPAAHTTVAIGSGFSGQINSTNHASNFAITLDYLPSQPGAWIISSRAVNAAGQPDSTIPAACKPTASASRSSRSDPLTCLASNGVQTAVTYQPASRYWAFQWYETAIFAVLTLALAGFCVWWIRYRRLA